jgi:PEGA domain
MSPLSRIATAALSSLMLLGAVPGISDAQQRAVPRHPPHPDPQVVVRGHVFVGGYFYDPFFGPYPWWGRTTYPYWYSPVYDNRADVRLSMQPHEAHAAAVYVDGFYAGIVDDFNGVFQALPLPPGGHRIILYLEGYRTVVHNIYLRPGSTFALQQNMERLPADVQSEPPDLAPPLPTPPAGTYRPPVTPSRLPAPAGEGQAVAATGFGTLDLFVQPVTAEVKIDGQSWVSSEEGHFVIQLPAGKHRVEITTSGHWTFATAVAVGDGATVPLNVSLMTGAN